MRYLFTRHDWYQDDDLVAETWIEFPFAFRCVTDALTQYSAECWTGVFGGRK